MGWMDGDGRMWDAGVEMEGCGVEMEGCGMEGCRWRNGDREMVMEG